MGWLKVSWHKFSKVAGGSYLPDMNFVISSLWKQSTFALRIIYSCRVDILSLVQWDRLLHFQCIFSCSLQTSSTSMDICWSRISCEELKFSFEAKWLNHYLKEMTQSTPTVHNWEKRIRQGFEDGSIWSPHHTSTKHSPRISSIQKSLLVFLSIVALLI